MSRNFGPAALLALVFVAGSACAQQAPATGNDVNAAANTVPAQPGLPGPGREADDRLLGGPQPYGDPAGKQADNNRAQQAALIDAQRITTTTATDRMIAGQKGLVPGSFVPAGSTNVTGRQPARRVTEGAALTTDPVAQPVYRVPRDLAGLPAPTIYRSPW